MTVTRSYFWLVAMLAAACCLGSKFMALEASAAPSSFERGAEEYFAGNDAVAERLMASAISEDPHDPRPYYYRALCLLREGRRVAARADMLVGATLEARSRGSYPIGESLARLPVAQRLMLAEFRWRTGAETAITGPENDAGEPSRPIATDAAVLRQKFSVRLDQLVRPVSLTELAQAPAPQSSTTAKPMAEPARQPSVQPAALPGVQPAAEETPVGNPFADDQPSLPEGKIPSGKLMGILGRALLKSAPLESFDALREKMPALPLPGTGGNSPPAVSGAGSDATLAPAVAPTDENPFSEPSSPPTEERNDQQNGTDANDEDPFG